MNIQATPRQCIIANCTKQWSHYGNDKRQIIYLFNAINAPNV